MHTVHFGSRAVKEFQRCSPEFRQALFDASEALAADPRPAHCRKLTGGVFRPLGPAAGTRSHAESVGALAGSYRIRVGAYRVIYEVYDRDHVVLVTKIGPRKSIYR